MALDALSELRRRNILVPERVGVVGFDDIAESAYSNTPLTTIAAGLQWIAKTAVRTLLDQLAEPSQTLGSQEHEPRQLVAGFHLVVRGSA